MLRHDDTTAAPLKTLRKLRVGIAFDDFGTGFASLSLLKRYAMTRLKIDRSFVSGICNDRVDAAVVNALVYLASSLDVEVIAMGVETGAQEYLYGRPMPLSKLLDLVADKRSLAA